MLDKQIGLYSITTSFFFTEKENEISRELSEMKKYKKEVTRPEYVKKEKQIKKHNDEIKSNDCFIEFEECANQLKQLYSIRKSLKEIGAKLKSNEFNPQYEENEVKIKYYFNRKKELKKEIEQHDLKRMKSTQEYEDNKFISDLINELSDELNSEFDKNASMIREITRNLNDKDKIMNFDNALFRAIGIEPDSFTMDIIVMRVYHYKVLKSIMINGFTINGEKYLFWSASAGQIRTKKCVFVKESVLKEYENTIYCGLTLDKINKPRKSVKNGEEIIEQGCNKNKYLAYSSLTATGTDEWTELNIDQVIVVDDFETVIDGVVDYIDYENYDDNGLWSIERKSMDIPIPTMDGCGISLDYTGMFRMPWCKGLFCQFDFKMFIKEMRAKYKPIDKEKWRSIGKVKDIYGKEYDLVKDDIRHIMTKSQFKMWKYYDSWEDYKENFKKYNCKAGKGNRDYTEFKRTKISYQPLQTLYDLSDEELIEILEDTNNTIEEISTDKETMLNVLGALNINERSTGMQKSIDAMPELINDKYTKNIIKDLRTSIINGAEYGKIEVDGTYAFLLPDVYAFAEWLFLGEEKPQGLLKDGEVSCRFIDNNVEVDVLRSPHLNFSHCIANNIRNEETDKWYLSNSIYTSSHSLYSLELMCDWDGDTGLILRTPTIINAAKRIREKHDIVPIFYHLKKAKDNFISKETLYQGIVDAYSGGNIGEVSNSITKVWNSGNITDKEFRAIAYLTLWNNVVIDSAKTLWFPDKSKEMEDFLKQYENNKLPYFFKFIPDKDKKEADVELINNSVVNRLTSLISKPTVHVKNVNIPKLDYKYMISKEVETDTFLSNFIVNKFKWLDKNKKLFKHEEKTDINKDRTSITMREKLEEFEIPREYIINVLVKSAFSKESSINKRSLWEMYGNEIFSIIEENTRNSKFCSVCGERFEPTNNKQKMCVECAYEKQLDLVRKSKEKAKNIN